MTVQTAEGASVPGLGCTPPSSTSSISWGNVLTILVLHWPSLSRVGEQSHDTCYGELAHVLTETGETKINRAQV